MRERQRSLPYRFYFLLVLLFSLIGILVTAYLTYSHYQNYTDPTYASFCAISQSINCDTVSQSPWAVIGGLPVSLWGLFGFLLFLILLLPLSQKKQNNLPLWKLLLFLSCVFSLTSLFFANISASRIHSFCILCIAIYGISFALLFTNWLICRRFKISPLFSNIKTALSLVVSSKRIYWPIITLFILFILVEMFLPHYWELEATEMPINIARGITENGHPWIGAERPVLTIEEFSDYQCFQCSKMHFLLRQLVLEYPERIRLVHRNYPLDHEFNPTVVPDPFHIGSGKMALLAVYATTQNKFWQMNDALYELGRSKKSFNTKLLAEQTGFSSGELTLALSDPGIAKRLNYDIWSGMKMRITATPTFVIDSKLYPGSIPENVLKKATQQ